MKAISERRSADNVGPQIGVTKENYVDRARAFVDCHGSAGFVVRGIEGGKGSGQSRQFATEPQWLAWYRYLANLGVPTKSMRFNGEATVPCEWPEDFDANAWPSDRSARLPRRVPDSPEARARVIAGFPRLKAEIGKAVAHMDVTPKPRPRRSWRDMTPKDASDRLNNLASEFECNPPVLSAALRERMGR